MDQNQHQVLNTTIHRLHNSIWIGNFLYQFDIKKGGGKKTRNRTHTQIEQAHHQEKNQWDTRNSPPKWNCKGYMIEHTHHSMDYPKRYIL